MKITGAKTIVTCLGRNRRGSAARYPYKLAYLPFARLEDGSMWNW